MTTSSGPTRLESHVDGQLRLLRHERGVLSALAVPPWAISTAPMEERGCIALDIASGGALHIGLASAGHWFGGPTMAHAVWPASRTLIARQQWRSNDMLGDREKLGSVLEATWLTSSGATLRVLSSSRFEASMNVPCDDGTTPILTAAPPDGELCFFTGGGGKDEPATDGKSMEPPLQLELCTAADIREAHVQLLRRLPRPTSPQPPALEVMRAPIWSTWARYKMDVDQEKVEAYALEIHERGFPRSHLEIDDRWSVRYGDMAFDAVKFPDAPGMVKRLKALGFTVTLWVTPFAEPASEAYAEGRAGGYWLKDGSGAPALITWWQGEGVALNVTDPKATAWMASRLRSLVESTGVDGFKFDAGEAQFVPEGAMAEPNRYCAGWARLAATFGGGGEVRCADGSQDVGLWTREFDKDSRWSLQNGLRALVTSALHLGVLGYPFVLPDMVGGNAYSEAMTSDGASDGHSTDRKSVV